MELVLDGMMEYITVDIKFERNLSNNIRSAYKKISLMIDIAFIKTLYYIYFNILTSKAILQQGGIILLIYIKGVYLSSKELLLNDKTRNGYSVGNPKL